jgi:hypothetical protein
MASSSSSSKLKVLQRDRKTFQKFCKFANIQDSDLLFDSAAAKEVPIDYHELLENAKNIQETSQARECLSEFASLVLEEELPVPLDMRFLREKWMQMQDVRNRDANSVDASLAISAVHEQIHQQALMIEDLENQLKERSRLIIDVENKGTQTEDVKISKKIAYVQTDLTQQQADVPAGSGPSYVSEEKRLLEERMQELQLKLKVAESDLRAMKDSKSVLESKIAALEKEKNRFSFVEDLARRQAERDAQVCLLQAEIEELRTSRPPSPALQSPPFSQDDSELKRNIFVKFVSYAIANDYDKMKSLIPVTTELFQLRRQDVEELGRACASDTGIFNQWLSLYLRI